MNEREIKLREMEIARLESIMDMQDVLAKQYGIVVANDTAKRLNVQGMQDLIALMGANLRQER